VSACLLYVNVLVALAWPSHVHHDVAHAWFSRHRGGGWATCPLTQCGFARISSNPKIIPEAVTPREALSVLARMTGQPDHVFWPDSVSVVPALAPFALVVGHRQVTDAYLLALAIDRGGRLATFDRGIPQLLAPGHPQAVELIEA